MNIAKKVQNEIDQLDKKRHQEQIGMNFQSQGDLKDGQKPGSLDSSEDTKDSSENSVQIGIDFQNDIEKNYLAIGALQIRWDNQHGEAIAVNYGTACAITKRIILTCTHNIYSQKREQFCSEVAFFPQVDQQRLDQQKSFRSVKGCFYRCLEPHFSFAQKPIKQELCLIVLQKDLPINQFIQIGNFSNKWTNLHEKLAIIGYPSERYWNAFQLENVQVDRHQLEGKVYSFQENIINHTMKTKKGYSGSPILYRSQEGKWMAIAIHTHRGEEGIYNSGLYFTPEIIRLMKKFQKQLKEFYNLNDCIQYKANDIEIQDLSFQYTGNQNQEIDSDFKELSSDISTEYSFFQSQIKPLKNEQIPLENSKEFEQENQKEFEQSWMIQPQDCKKSEENNQILEQKVQIVIEIQNEKQSSLSRKQSHISEDSQSEFNEVYQSKLKEMNESVNQMQRQKEIEMQQVDKLRPQKQKILKQPDLKSKQHSIIKKEIQWLVILAQIYTPKVIYLAYLILPWLTWDSQKNIQDQLKGVQYLIWPVCYVEVAVET